MPASSKPSAVTEVVEVVVVTPVPTTGKPWLLLSNPIGALETLLRRDEADLLFIAGNVALAAFEIIEWPVAVLTVAVHAMARSRFKALKAVAEVAEEVE
jgi:hypothetical protein